MLQLTELRIGNFFEIDTFFEGKKKIKQITEISQKHAYIDGNWHGLNRIIPVTITEDILLQAGFKPFNWLVDSSVFECDYFKCVFTGEGIQIFCNNLKNLKPIKYLHNLQNLYFDLTGEEMNIEIKKLKPAHRSEAITF